MKTTNLAGADGLPAIEWSEVELQLADLLMRDDPRAPNRSTFWLTTLNADGSPHVTRVGALCTRVAAGSRRSTAPDRAACRIGVRHPSTSVFSKVTASSRKPCMSTKNVA